MCRLILMNKNGEKEIEKNYGLSNYLKYLEDSFGGHGNGVALLRKGKITYLNKGINLSVKEIANVIRKRAYDWCIFHTRLASVGSKSDKNCHPFIIGNEVMAMNGTERTEQLLTSAQDITDTEAILKVKEKFNLEIPVLQNLNSIFVGFSKGKPYVVANNTYNIKLMYRKNDNSVVFASNFPDKMKKNIYNAKNSFIWNDEEIDMSNFKRRKKEKQNKYIQTTFYDIQDEHPEMYFNKNDEERKYVYDMQDIEEEYESIYKEMMSREEYYQMLIEEGVRFNAA